MQHTVIVVQSFPRSHIRELAILVNDWVWLTIGQKYPHDLAGIRRKWAQERVALSPTLADHPCFEPRKMGDSISILSSTLYYRAVDQPGDRLGPLDSAVGNLIARQIPTEDTAF